MTNTLFKGRFQALTGSDVSHVLVNYRGTVIGMGGEEVANSAHSHRVVELPGVAMPGFRSEHDHFLFTLVESALSIDGMSERQVAKLIADNVSADRWLVLTDWNDAVIPARQMAGCVEIGGTGHDVLVLNTSWHSAIGSAALIDKLMPTLRMMDLATGMCKGQLLTEDHVLQAIALLQTDYKNLHDAIMRRQQLLFGRGVTTMYDKLVHGQLIHDVLAKASYDGTLKYRVSAAVQPWMMRNGLKPGLRGEHLNVRWLKYLADGSFGSRTAFMSREHGMLYADGSEGVFQLPARGEIFADLRDWLELGGEGLCIHCIGPGAVERVVDLFAWLYQELNDSSVRLSLEHGTTWVPGLVERFAEMQAAGYNVRLCSQMSFTEDITQYADRIPALVAERINPYADFERCGVVYTGGTDGPICNDDHLGGTSQAVNRPGPQAIDALTALTRVTEGPIQVGQPFNVVCLDLDPVEKPGEMALAVPLQTWIWGECVWQKSE